MTLELILFTIATMFGVLLYWRESKSNSLFRFVNKLLNSTENQMKKTNRKGFLFMQPFLMRLVYVVLLFLIGFLVINFLTPINIFSPKYFATTIVGTIAGTYFASLIVLANEKIDSSQDIIEDTFEKGKDFIEDITDDVKEKFISKEEKENIEEKHENEQKNKSEKPKKSGRDRLKEKGLL